MILAIGPQMCVVLSPGPVLAYHIIKYGNTMPGLHPVRHDAAYIAQLSIASTHIQVFSKIDRERNSSYNFTASFKSNHKRRGS